MSVRRGRRRQAWAFINTVTSDVIDHEHWTGDPNKMILGSLKEAMDDMDPNSPARVPSAAPGDQFDHRLRSPVRNSTTSGGLFSRRTAKNRLSGIFKGNG
jgi:hypothetical protein